MMNIEMKMKSLHNNKLLKATHNFLIENTAITKTHAEYHDSYSIP